MQTENCASASCVSGLGGATGVAGTTGAVVAPGGRTNALVATRLTLLLAENAYGVWILEPPLLWGEMAAVIEEGLEGIARREYLRDQRGWFVESASVDDVVGELRARLCEAGFDAYLTAKALDVDDIKPVVRVSVDEGGNFSDVTISTGFVPSRNRVARLVRNFAVAFGATHDELGRWFIPSPTLFGWADVGLLELVDSLEAAGAIVLEDLIWHEQYSEAEEALHVA